jgi:hypothetical protein
LDYLQPFCFVFFLFSKDLLTHIISRLQLKQSKFRWWCMRQLTIALSSPFWQGAIRGFANIQESQQATEAWRLSMWIKIKLNFLPCSLPYPQLELSTGWQPLKTRAIHLSLFWDRSIHVLHCSDYPQLFHLDPVTIAIYIVSLI